MKTGYVQWFDDSSGEGMIYCPWTQRSYYVHWSAISEPEKTREQWYSLKRNQPVEFTLYENLYSAQVDRVKPLNFDYTVESEIKLNQLLNQLWETSDIFAFDLAELYYNEF